MPFSEFPNSKQQTVQACDPSIRLTWKDMNAENRNFFIERRRRQPDLRNQRTGIIAVCVEGANHANPQHEPRKYPSVQVRA